MAPESHISSVIVYVKTEHIANLIENISLMAYVDVAMSVKEQGKLITVIDTPTVQLAEHTICTIKNQKGVLSTALIYHHVDTNDVLDCLIDSPISEDVLSVFHDGSI